MMHTYTDDAQGAARSVFAGLTPRVSDDPDERLVGLSPRSRAARNMFATGSVILAGSMAAMGLTGPVSAAELRPTPKPRGNTIEPGKNLRAAVGPAGSAITTEAKAAVAPAPAAAPASYVVAPGDTVSSIAGQFGLSTASVLALNGLGWSSTIFPGQELKLSAASAVTPVEAPPEATPSGRYTIVSGDTISGIAERFGVSTLSVLTANGLGWSSIIYPGQTLAIPGLIGPGTPADDPSTFEPVAAITPVEEPVVAPPAAAEAVVVDSPPTPEPAAPEPVAPAATTYTIVSGDTVGTIAARFGIDTLTLLNANGLDLSSVIFAGHSLVIPAAGQVAVAAVAPAATGSSLTDEMRSNAAVIVQVGRSLGVSDYGIVIALATAMQESTLRNLSWGDRDSVGLFQQRPSSGWGTIEQLTTPAHAAALFYGGPSNPNTGYTRGLLDISGWESMPLTEAAQRVQISAYPDAYAKWESSAWEWLTELS
jgi:N-acetylmuramoyl-L-alanine amidase